MNKRKEKEITMKIEPKRRQGFRRKDRKRRRRKKDKIKKNTGIEVVEDR